jgi:hypothetical protein
MQLERGMDFRLPEYRREVFLRFWMFHCRYRSHPGAVYYLLPWLRGHYGWTAEEALWFAFLNGNTQHPVTSLILHQRCPDPADGPAVFRMLAFYREHYARLAFDTDRRHWKGNLPDAVSSYRRLLRRYGGSQAQMWEAAASGGFAGVWDTATSIHGFGRLSAFSYTEYLKIMGVPFDCDDLMLGDRDGSRSHRNGLCIATGQDDLVWDKALGSYDGRYPPETIASLERLAAGLREEARDRARGEAWLQDVDYFTLESALCTYKSWHKPNRRYPGVYNDLLYDRLKRYEQTWPGGEKWTAPFWRARRECLPRWLRLEDQPYDPGCVPLKQNWYREYGEVPVMGHDDPAFWSTFDLAVGHGEFGLRKDIRGRREVLR